MTSSGHVDWLFVNAAGDPSRKDSQRLFKIHSHLSKTRRQVNRGLRLKQLESSLVDRRKGTLMRGYPSSDVDKRSFTHCLLKATGHSRHDINDNVPSVSRPGRPLSIRARDDSDTLHERDEADLPGTVVHKATTLLESSPVSLLTLVGCGPRKEPFGTFPSETDNESQMAFDYYASVYVPGAVKDLLGEPGNPLFSAYFHSILHDQLLFHVVIVFSQSVRGMGGSRPVGADRCALYHKQQALTLLRGRTSDRDLITTDASVLSLVMLCACAAISNDFQGLSCHADGLKRVVALRGGMDSLGMGEYMKTRVAQVENGYLAWQRRQQLEQQVEAAPASPLSSEWPSVPFSADFEARCALLPIGFRRLCLQSRLRMRVVGFVQRCVQIYQHQPLALAVDVIEETFPEVRFIAQSFELNPVERLLVLTFAQYCILYEFVHEGSIHPVHVTWAESQIAILAKAVDVHEETRDFWLWAALVLEKIGSASTTTVRFARKILDTVASEPGRISRLEEDFLAFPRQLGRDDEG